MARLEPGLTPLAELAAVGDQHAPLDERLERGAEAERVHRARARPAPAIPMPAATPAARPRPPWPRRCAARRGAPPLDELAHHRGRRAAERERHPIGRGAGVEIRVDEAQLAAKAGGWPKRSVKSRRLPSSSTTSA